MNLANPGSGFDDMPDDLDGISDPNPHKRIAAEAARPVLYRAQCKRCGGTGSFGRVSQLGHSRCLGCDGRGFNETKTAPAELAARQERKEKRKFAAACAKLTAGADRAKQWRAEHAAEALYLDEQAAKGNTFCQELAAKLLQWGSLTDGQVGALQRGMLRDADRAAANASQTARKQAVDITPVIKAFERAGASLRSPILRTEHFRFSKASAFGRNAGAIYVKTLGSEDVEGTYLGKIQDGVFSPSRDCSVEQQAWVMQVCEDPLGAVVRYGRLTGRCGICAKKLTKGESVERGIGPICAEKFGF